MNFATAHAEPPPLEVYGALPATEDLALSPNGKLVALINTIGEKRMLVVSQIDGATLVTDKVGDEKISGLRWAGDAYLVVLLHRTGRSAPRAQVHHEDELIQGVVVDVATGKLHPLLLPSRSSFPAIIGNLDFARTDGHWYGYTGIIPMDSHLDTLSGHPATDSFFKQSFPDLCRIDLGNGDQKRLFRGGPDDRHWVVDADGKIVAVSDYKSDSGNWVVYRPGSALSLTQIASGHADFGFEVFGLGRTPGTVLLHASDTEDVVTEMRLDDGYIDQFLPAGRVLDLSFSPVTHLLQSARVAGDAGEDDRTLAFDPTLERDLASIAKAFPGKYVELSSVSADLKRVVVKVSGGDISGTWQLVDFAEKKARPLADAYSGIPDGMVGVVKQITYKAGDGLVIPAILTLPPGRAAHALPLVVFPHRGPEAVDRPIFDWWAQAFASRGYAVLQPNFRGSDGYGEQFRNAGFGEWGRKMQTDVSDGIGYLAAQGIVDSKRVCIVGASYGGYVAMAGVTLQHGLYRCAASYGGVSDPEALLRIQREKAGPHDMESITRYWEKYLGADSPRAEIFDTVSPQKHAAQADAPILLIHGVKDTVVPIVQSEAMESALKKAGKPVEFARLDNEDHWLSRSATRLQMLKVMVAFVEKYNPPD